MTLRHQNHEYLCPLTVVKEWHANSIVDWNLSVLLFFHHSN